MILFVGRGGYNSPQGTGMALSLVSVIANLTADKDCFDLIKSNYPKNLNAIFFSYFFGMDGVKKFYSWG